jgi:hypothetical protein
VEGGRGGDRGDPPLFILSSSLFIYSFFFARIGYFLT